MSPGWMLTGSRCLLGTLGREGVGRVANSGETNGGLGFLQVLVPWDLRSHRFPILALSPVSAFPVNG